MKKNLAKKITLSILAGAMLMSSSVAWAETIDNTATGTNAIAIGSGSQASGGGSNAIGYSAKASGEDSNAVGRIAVASGGFSNAVGYMAVASNANSHAFGSNAEASGVQSIAIGSFSEASGFNSIAIGFEASASEDGAIALGFGSIANEENVVSVGDGGAKDINGNSYGPDTRSIINVSDVGVNDLGIDKYGSYAVNVNTLNAALASVQATNDATYVKIKDDGTTDGKVVISENKGAQVTFEDDKVIFGTNSSWYEANQGFFAGGDANHTVSSAKAALKEDGSLMGASGKFEVDTSGNVTAASYIIKDNNGNVTNIKAALDSKANSADVYKKTETYSQTEVDSKVNDLQQVDLDLQTQINNIGGDNTSAIAGLNQRLEKTNAKINKVGAGAAALAALHPLDYDPDDKLTFSAGMGNYAGENATALGAFYRPNEKFMLSLGGTMGNGENMVNLGLSIGLDKASGLAKLSKRELIQKVNVMEAKYEQVEAENEAMKAEIIEMKAMLQELLAKK